MIGENINELVELNKKFRVRKEPITLFGETLEDKKKRLQKLELEKPINYETGKEIEKLDEKLEEEKERIKKEEQLLEEEKEKSMKPNEKKLFELRLRMNQSRKQNMEQVMRESSTKVIPKKQMYKSKKKQREEEQNLNITAELSEKIESKKQKKENTHQPHGWEVFNTETLYNSHKKRVKNIPYSKEEYEHTKSIAEEKGPLEYGQDNTPEVNKNRMVKELQDKMEKRKKFSRRRMHNEDEDVTYINESNRVFNKKLNRSFDKYTAELKQNLERGSAL